MKVRDGSSRAAPPALVRVLETIGVLDDRAVSSLAALASPPVLGGDDVVGGLRADVNLNRS